MSQCSPAKWSLPLMLGVGLAWLPGCAASPTIDDDARPWQGIVRWGHEVREFHACGVENAVWVVDETGELWERVRAATGESVPYRETYVRLRGSLGPKLTQGFGAEYAGTLRVTEVLTVGGTEANCPEG